MANRDLETRRDLHPWEFFTTNFSSQVQCPSGHRVYGLSGARTKFGAKVRSCTKCKYAYNEKLAAEKRPNLLHS